jgi:hypothetical protein
VHAGTSSARRSARRAVQAAVAVILCAVATAGAAAQDDRHEHAGPGGPGPGTTAFHEKWELERTALRESPVERERRLQSRTAYAGQSDRAALATARAEQRAVVETPVWRAVPDDARLEQFLGDHSARLEIGGRSSFVESTTPLRARNEAGEEAPVDLSLVPRAGGFALRNPAVPVGLPDAAGGWLSFERSGVRLRHAVARPEVRATEVEGRLHYANVDVDTDLLAMPQPNGAETFLILRSAESPERGEIDVDLPAGAELRAHPAAPGGVQVVRDDEVLVSMLPPLGWDADGEPFTVTFEPAGSKVIVRFEHRDRDLRYPLVVDPFSTEGFYDTGESQASWHTAKSGNWELFYVCSSCMFTRTLGGNTSSDWAEWHYRARGVAYVWRLDSYTNFDNGNGAGGMYQGFVTPTTKNWWHETYWYDSLKNSGMYSPKYTYFAHQNYLQRHSVSGDFLPPVTSNNQQYVGLEATLGLYVPYPERLPGYTVQANFFTTYVFVDDLDSPVLYDPVSQPSGWIRAGESADNPTLPAPARATDQGLGVYEFEIWAPKIGGGSQAIDAKKHPTCDGTQIGGDKRCPTEWGPGSPGYEVSKHAIRYSVAELPEGINNLTLRAYDLSSHPSDPRQWNVKVDRTGPALELGGSLKRNEGRRLYGTSYDLSATATDGEPSATADSPDPPADPALRRAGTRSVRVWVKRTDVEGAEEQELGTATDAAPDCMDNCKFTAHRMFVPASHEPGDYRIRVHAVDNAGNESEASFNVVVPPVDERPTTLGLEEFETYEDLDTGAGSRAFVNLANGNLIWHHTPVVNRGRGLSTVVNLTYNGQEDRDDPIPGEADDVLDAEPAGRRFSIAASSLTRLNEPLDVGAADLGGPVMLVDADGTRHRFMPDGIDSSCTALPISYCTKYAAPAGVNLHLRRYGDLPEQALLAPQEEAWAVTRPDGVTHFFDSRGYPTSVRDRNGNRLVFVYQHRLLPVSTATAWAEGRCPLNQDAAMFDDVVCEQRVTAVIDAAGVDAMGVPIPSKADARSVKFAYYPTCSAKRVSARAGSRRSPSMTGASPRVEPIRRGA